MTGHLTSFVPWFIRGWFYWLTGYFVVGVFFFYSGYGLIFSCENSGRNYVNTLPKKKLFNIYLPALVVSLICVVLSFFAEGEMTVSEFLISVFSLGICRGMLWYITELLVLNVVFYIAVRAGVRPDGLYWVFIYAIFLLIAVYFDIGTWWYVSTSCFLVGIYYRRFRKLISFLRDNNVVYILLLTIFVLTYLIVVVPIEITGNGRPLFCPEGIPSSYFIVFCEIVQTPIFVILLLRLKLNLSFFRRVGVISFEIYIWHLPYMVGFGLIAREVILLILVSIFTLLTAVFMNKARKLCVNSIVKMA